MKKILVVCDICEDPEKETKNYRLVSEGRVKDLDLCGEDAAPIEKFLEGTRPRGGARTSSAPRGSGNGRRKAAGTSRTMTLEEIEAQKAAEKEKAS